MPVAVPEVWLKLCYESGVAGPGLRRRREAERHRGDGEDCADDPEPWDSSHRRRLPVCAGSTQRGVGVFEFPVLFVLAVGEWDVPSIVVASRR